MLECIGGRSVRFFEIPPMSAWMVGKRIEHRLIE